VELNRAVAYAMAFGPAAGLEIVDALASEPQLAADHLLPAVRGDFLSRLGRLDEARARRLPDAQRARARDSLLTADVDTRPPLPIFEPRVPAMAPRHGVAATRHPHRPGG